jgi:hypothetical protein
VTEVDGGEGIGRSIGRSEGRRFVGSSGLDGMHQLCSGIGFVVESSELETIKSQ